eukprot:m.102727 g.102727  ORF g.102727 m.102727 type:complete len:517 (-) comp15525_c0_seq1:144-1694(-)
MSFNQTSRWLPETERCNRLLAHYRRLLDHRKAQSHADLNDCACASCCSYRPAEIGPVGRRSASKPWVKEHAIDAITVSVHDRIVAAGPKAVEAMFSASPVFHSFRCKQVEEGKHYYDLYPTSVEGAALSMVDVGQAMGELFSRLLPERDARAVANYEIHFLERSVGDSDHLSTRGDDGLSPLSARARGEPVRDGSSDPLWHHKMINLTDAIKRVYDGTNIKVAHPDTGYRRHPELSDDAIDISNSKDFWREDEHAIIHVDEHKHHGRHGLATGSVIVSDPNNPLPAGMTQVTGVAPGATLAPLRVTAPQWFKPGPVLVSSVRLRDAVSFAAKRNLDVISMSLGMPFKSRGLQEALRTARSKGMIAVAAAGNYTFAVDIYPAAYPEVISCAALGPDAKPWSASGYGQHVDLIAPGHRVWVATVTDANENITRRSSGTSHATATMAGVACLWLQRHGGRQAILDRVPASFPDPGFKVQDAFVIALRKASQNTPDLPQRHYGMGLVDVERLLQLPLEFV